MVWAGLGRSVGGAWCLGCGLRCWLGSSCCGCERGLVCNLSLSQAIASALSQAFLVFGVERLEDSEGRCNVHDACSSEGRRSTCTARVEDRRRRSAKDQREAVADKGNQIFGVGLRH